MIQWALVILALVSGIYWAWPSGPIRHSPGVLAPREPAQTEVTGRAIIPHDDLQLYPLARFEVEARVLSTKRYAWFGSRWFGREASLAPVDWALGWGPMSDQQVVDRLEISQGSRFYYYRWHGPAPPLPLRTIVEHSANMHLIPGSPAVWRELEAVRPGHVVHFSGYLVSARARDGWRWDSSLTRKDSGPGACELVWVEAISFTAR